MRTVRFSYRANEKLASIWVGTRFRYLVDRDSERLIDQLTARGLSAAIRTGSGLFVVPLASIIATVDRDGDDPDVIWVIDIDEQPMTGRGAGA